MEKCQIDCPGKKREVKDVGVSLSPFDDRSEENTSLIQGEFHLNHNNRI